MGYQEPENIKKDTEDMPECSRGIIYIRCGLLIIRLDFIMKADTMNHDHTAPKRAVLSGQYRLPN